MAITALLIIGLTAPALLASSGGDTHGNTAESDAAVHGDQAAEAHGTEGGAHGAGGDAHGEGGAHGGGWAATDTYRVMNFAVLAIALFLIARKPLPKALNSRIDGIREQLDDLEGKKSAAEKNLVQYNEKISALDQESESIVQEYIRQGEDVKARIIEEAGTAAEKLKEQATKNITNEINMAKDRIKANVVESALQKAEQLIKANITQDDQNRLVDEYLEKVVV
ncbi:MAG: ATP synthase F0 subunit B [Desulfobacterales bacterium]